MRAALLLVTTAACAGTPFVRPHLAERRWIELTSEHFVVTTDLPPGDARRQVADIERQWWLLADNLSLLVPGQPPARPLLVTLFADCADYRAVATWEEASGFASESQDGQRQPVYVTCEARGSPHLLLHELVHLFNAAMLGWTPVWLNEGLAEYFSSMVVEDGQVVLGHMPPLAHLHWQFVWRLNSYGDLLRRNAVDFYGPTGVRRYLAAWKLVHLLASDAYRPRFQVYLAALAGGATRDEAWRLGFGDDPEPRLRADYAAYDATGTVRLWRAPALTHPTAAPRERRLGRGEIHGHWVSMQLLRLNDFDRDDRDVSPLLHHLDRAAKDDPGWDAVDFWRGVVLARFGDPAALPPLRRHLARHPDDARAWMVLLAFELERAGGLGGGGDVTALADDAHALLRRAATPAELEVVARYHAMAGKPEVALNFAERAIALDRGCGPCLETLAALAFQRGDRAQAVLLQERAIDTAVDVAVPPAMLRRLATYRAERR